MSNPYSRMQILEMIEKGEISLEDGLRMLEDANQAEEDAEREPSQQVDSVDEPGPMPVNTGQEDLTNPPLHVEGVTSQQVSPGGTSPVPPVEPVPESERVEIVSKIPEDAGSEDAFDEPDTGYKKGGRGMPEGVEKWRRWWTIPLWIGVGITVLGGLFMLLAYLGSQIGFWFLCWSVFFAFGVVIIALSAQSRTARWLHLRVKQRPGERPANIAISFPLPLRLARWLMRIFGHWIPNTGGASAEDIISALDAVDETVSFENPVYIEVDDEDGEHVEIYIG